MFTFISKVTDFTGGTWNTPAVFYREDISMLLNQPQAIGVRVVNAIFESGTHSYALVAVKVRRDGAGEPMLDTEGHGLYDDLNSDNNLVALGCLPYNVRGGELLPNP